MILSESTTFVLEFRSEKILNKLTQRTDETYKRQFKQITNILFKKSTDVINTAVTEFQNAQENTVVYEVNSSTTIPIFQTMKPWNYFEYHK